MLISAVNALTCNMNLFAQADSRYVCRITTRAWDLVDNFASLYGWGGVLNVNQVGYQGRVGLLGSLDVVEVEPWGY